MPPWDVGEAPQRGEREAVERKREGEEEDSHRQPFARLYTLYTCKYTYTPIHLYTPSRPLAAPPTAQAHKHIEREERERRQRDTAT